MKTHKTVQIPVADLIPNPKNPNEMTEAQFTKLCEQIAEYGFVEPIMVAPDAGSPGKYRIIGGHHRHKAAMHLGMEKVPAVIMEDWDEKRQEIAMIRMNVVRGKLSPQKFITLWDQYVNEIGEDAAKDLLGFADEGALEEIKRQIKKGLPKEIQKKVEEAESRGEIGSVEDLTKVVSTIMSEFGESVPCNFVHFAHGGKKHIMQRTDEELWNTVQKFYWAVEAEGLDALSVLKLIFKGWEDIVLRRQKRERAEEGGAADA